MLATLIGVINIAAKNLKRENPDIIKFTVCGIRRKTKFFVFHPIPSTLNSPQWSLIIADEFQRAGFKSEKKQKARLLDSNDFFKRLWNIFPYYRQLF